MANTEPKTPNNATKAVHTEDIKSQDQLELKNDREFAGDVRFEGTILVERKVGDDWAVVLTDKPRPGDRIQAQDYNEDTGDYEVSKRDSTSTGGAPPKK